MMSETHFFAAKIHLLINILFMAPINLFIDKTLCCMNKNESDFGYEQMVISLFVFFYFY